MGAFNLSSQTEYSYRIINENVFTYNDIIENSIVNPSNILQLNELDIVNRFFPLGTFEKNKIKLQVEPRIFLSPLDEELQFGLNELYLQYSFSENLYVTFGKERINWGTGNVWNPSNPFLQKDPFRLNNRQEGIVLTDLEYITSSFTLNALFSPEKKINKSTFALRFGSEISSFSYSLSYAFLGDEKQQFSGDFSLGASNFTLYGEGVLRNFSNTNLIDSEGVAQTVPVGNGFENTHSEFVLGTLYNIQPRTLLIMEYRYRSDFNTSKNIENFEKFLPNNLSQYDPISMGRHSFYGQIGYTDSYSKYNINTSVFFDPITKQLLCMPELIYNGNDFKVEVSPFIFNNNLSIYDFQGRIILSFFL